MFKAFLCFIIRCHYVFVLSRVLLPLVRQVEHKYYLMLLQQRFLRDVVAFVTLSILFYVSYA